MKKLNYDSKIVFKIEKDVKDSFKKLCEKSEEKKSSVLREFIYKLLQL